MLGVEGDALVLLLAVDAVVLGLAVDEVVLPLRRPDRRDFFGMLCRWLPTFSRPWVTDDSGLDSCCSVTRDRSGRIAIAS